MNLNEPSMTQPYEQRLVRTNPCRFILSLNLRVHERTREILLFAR